MMNKGEKEELKNGILNMIFAYSHEKRDGSTKLDTTHAMGYTYTSH
jgi:hypothetical protein